MFGEGLPTPPRIRPQVSHDEVILETFGRPAVRGQETLAQPGQLIHDPFMNQSGYFPAACFAS